MGQFSWLDCITEEQILDDVERDVYVLIPKEFGGGHIKETCYDGYGRFGGLDIYELVADWNRKYITADHVFPHEVKYWQSSDVNNNVEFKAKEKDWWMAYSDYSIDQRGVEYITGHEWRWIGIELACYDEDNAALPFPIKITHDPNATYEMCGPSKSDPNQGWKIEDEYEHCWNTGEYDDQYCYECPHHEECSGYDEED